MTENLSKASRKEVMKEIIYQLHHGLSIEAAKERFEREIGQVTANQIAEMEQSLISDGVQPEEIKKFCNVHALLFQSSLEKNPLKETSPSHPVFLFKAENREIEKLVDATRSYIDRKADLSEMMLNLREQLTRLSAIEKHYERKEQLLFPYLEKVGFTGPSKVMWAKHNEVRSMLKAALAGLETVKQLSEWNDFIAQKVNPLLEEITGMIFKEENILFPTALEKLNGKDWVAILQGSDEVGYVFIEKPAETSALIKELKAALVEEPFFQEGAVSMPSGNLTLQEVVSLLNTLPIELTFVDANDKVRYFSENKERVFTRTRAIIGREVRNCHPPQSVKQVEKILASFKNRTRDQADFWMKFMGKLIYVRFLPVRSKDGEYLGTLEITQDVTKIHSLEGEQRLLDERD
jgi:hypothetical protein